MSEQQQPRDEATGRFTREPTMNEQIRFAASRGRRPLGDVFGPDQPEGQPEAEPSAPVGQSSGFGGGITSAVIPNESPPEPVSMNDLIRDAARAARG